MERSDPSQVFEMVTCTDENMITENRIPMSLGLSKTSAKQLIAFCKRGFYGK